MKPDDSNPLCLECGLCCNGVIFADVQLQPGDDARRLASLGLPVGAPVTRRPAVRESKPDSVAEPLKFPQPCAGFEGCRCRIYDDRPKYCREFECLTLKRVNAGRLGLTEAQRIIREARRRADNVRRLLLELGDKDERTALSLRFQRMTKRVESHPADDETADTYSRLTLAVHDLNLLLAQAFYPGA